MAIPLLGQTESIIDATLNNSGDSRGLSDPSGRQTCRRRSPTRNQQRVASARGYHFSRSDRSLYQRRDRKGRPCAHDKGTRSKSHPQTHLAKVGHLPASGDQTVSCSGLAPEIAIGPKDQRPSSGSHVPPLRESYALGIDSLRTQPHGPSRTQRSQQAPQTSPHFDGGGIWNAAQSARPSLSLYGPSGRAARGFVSAK
jgi:hypothetical protein